MINLDLIILKVKIIVKFLINFNDNFLIENKKAYIFFILYYTIKYNIWRDG
jgi:hypothetical protein